MGSNVVQLRGRKTAHSKRETRRRSLVDSWRDLYEVIQEIPDENLKQEALEFWNNKVPIVLTDYLCS